jgi:hypothetical protein
VQRCCLFAPLQRLPGRDQTRISKKYRPTMNRHSLSATRRHVEAGIIRRIYDDVIFGNADLVITSAKCLTIWRPDLQPRTTT